MIEKLPELVLTEVFRNLQIYDQLAIRRVCKSWKAVVEKELLSRRELILFHKTQNRDLFWFHDGSPVDLGNSIISNDQFKLNQFFWQIFQNIRRLYIVCYVEFLYEPSHLEFVNRFIHLEHLQIDVLPYDVVQYRISIEEFEYVLNLRKLKSFCCHSELLQMQFHVKNSPSLEMFAAPCDYIRFNKKRCGSFRESLKFLKVQCYSFRRGFFFPNLESFHFQTFSGCPQNRLQISLHPKLKEIHCYSNFYRGKIFYIYPSEHLDALWNQKKLLGWRKPDIFCLGLRWTPESAGAIMHLPRSYLNETEVQLFRENSKHLKLEHAKRNLIYAPDFDNYLAALDEQQLERLARCIEVVEFPEILKNNAALTAKYQTLFRYVRLLILSEQFKEQRDLNRLPELFPHLLEIKEGSQGSLFRRGNLFEICRNPAAFPNLFRKAFNFDFLARFPALTRLETDGWNLSRAEFERILQNCRFLRVAVLSRMQLMGSLETPIRTERSVYTISLCSAIKIKVSRHPYSHVPLSAFQMHDPAFNPFRGNDTKQFSSLQELLGYMSLDGYFFEEN